MAPLNKPPTFDAGASGVPDANRPQDTYSNYQSDNPLLRAGWKPSDNLFEATNLPYILNPDSGANDFQWKHYPPDLFKGSPLRLQHYTTINILEIDSPRYTFAEGDAGTSTSTPENQGGGLTPGLNRTANYKRLKAAIALAMPEELQSSTGTEYEQAVNGIAALDSLTGLASVSGFKEGMARATDFGTGALTGLVDAFIPGDAIPDIDYRNVLNKLGRAMNPHQEQLFRGVPFRNFTFSWKLGPRSEEETVQIDTIYKMLKFHSLPELELHNNNRYFVLPAQFEIQFNFRNGPNYFLHKIGPCALTQINMNYTPQGMWSAYENGAPVSCVLDMTFTELAIMHKQRVVDGY